MEVGDWFSMTVILPEGSSLDRTDEEAFTLLKIYEITGKEGHLRQGYEYMMTFSEYYNFDYEFNERIPPDSRRR